jgi:hypothetical protein
MAAVELATPNRNVATPGAAPALQNSLLKTRTNEAIKVNANAEFAQSYSAQGKAHLSQGWFMIQGVGRFGSPASLQRKSTPRRQLPSTG